MPLIAEQLLREQALADTRQHLSELVKADLRIDPGPSKVSWDPSMLRHVSEHQFDVWRRFDDVHMLVSPEGRILSFWDKNRFQMSGPPPYAPLTDELFLRIASTTGLVGPGARLAQTMPSPEGTVARVVVQRELGLPSRTLYTVNLSTKQVASFNVLDEVPS